MVTVEAVLKLGSSVAEAATSVQAVESENLAFPEVADVLHMILASMLPEKSAGRRIVFCAENPPEVSAY